MEVSKEKIFALQISMVINLIRSRRPYPLADH
jgi:hypothetical protein